MRARLWSCGCSRSGRSPNGQARGARSPMARTGCSCTLPGASSIRVPARAWLPTRALPVGARGGRGSGLLRRVAAFRLKPEATGVSGRCRRPPRRQSTRRHLCRRLVLRSPRARTRADAARRDSGRGDRARSPDREGFWNAITAVSCRACRVSYGQRVQRLRAAAFPARCAARSRIFTWTRSNPYRMLADLYVIVRPNTPPHVAHWVTEHPGAQRVHACSGCAGLQAAQAQSRRAATSAAVAPARAAPAPVRLPN